MIVDISSTVLALFGVDTVYRSVTNSIVDGEATKTYSNEVQFRAAIVPLTGDDLKNSVDGQYSTEDKVIISTVKLKKGDIVSYEGSWFEVRNIVDVNGIVGIIKYIGKRLEYVSF